MTYACRSACMHACMRARAHTHTRLRAPLCDRKNEILMQISRSLSSGDAVDIRLHAKVIGLHADLDSTARTCTLAQMRHTNRPVVQASRQKHHTRPSPTLSPPQHSVTPVPSADPSTPPPKKKTRAPTLQNETSNSSSASNAHCIHEPHSKSKYINVECTNYMSPQNVLTTCITVEAVDKTEQWSAGVKY
jgi:hypothetical protein